MALIDAFLTDAAPFNVWIANRSDRVSGSGTASDPFNGATRRSGPIGLSLAIEGVADARKAIGTTASPHGFQNGDVIEISRAQGTSAEKWNGIFTIYSVTATTFSYYMKKPADDLPGTVVVCSKLTFPFDEVMRQAPERIQVRIGPGVFQTRGFAPNDARGWQPKTIQNIVGAGIDVTTLQLVGAEKADQHYHVVGMPIEPGGSAALAPLKHFSISELTIDCNVDGHSGRPDPGYANVACGAVRVIGDHARIRNVKAINWGTKSLKQGCFVLSIIQSSAKPNDANGNPILTETQCNVIEDCICIQPSKNNARETTVLHFGGVKNATNHAQGFGTGAVIRKNFVDCQFIASIDLTHSAIPFPSHFITSKQGTGISGDTGTFIGKRMHFRNSTDRQTFVRLYNPANFESRWNGYFPITAFGDTDDTLFVSLASSVGTNDDSSLVIMGTEFRAIGVSSGMNAVVEQNQIHNCWIGGPYQSPLDDSVNGPSVPPTLAREERLDPLNALNTRSLTVRDNYYRNVAVGPYFNMGGVSGAVSQNWNVYFYSGSLLVGFGIGTNTGLWLNARVFVESSASQVAGLREVAAFGPFGGDNHPATAFAFYITENPPSFFTGTYRLASGTDHLVIEGNQIYLADLDETEFAIKEYPLAANPAEQRYRAYGIVVADNEMPTANPAYAHRQVIIRNNRIGYPDGQTLPVLPGLGRPVGGGMMLAGIAQLHVTHNVLELQGAPALRAFRCGTARFFHNNRPNGEIIPGFRWESQSSYDEPESIVEDAFVLSLLTRRKWR